MLDPPPPEKRTIVRFSALCAARERLVCESSAGVKHCICAADTELERIFDGFGRRVD